MTTPSILLQAKEKFAKLLESRGLQDLQISISAEPLSSEEAIGHPTRRDFPIVEGKEKMIEARIERSKDQVLAKGQAFTDQPGNFTGTLQDLMDLPLDNNQHRAFFIAGMNAVLRHLRLTDRTVHCKDEDPEKCSREIAAFLLEKHGRLRVGLIGLNPAILQALSETFGGANVLCTDLNPDNIGKLKFDVTIWDGHIGRDDLILQSDLILFSGTTLVNDTFDGIFRAIEKLGRVYYVYGITGAGVCQLMNLNRICFYGRDC